MSRTNVRVVVRFRPVNQRERESSADPDDPLAVAIENESRTVVLNHLDSTHAFHFDYVFPMTTTQEDFYTTACLPVITDVLKGFNGTIFAFGPYGSGKTWTMTGPGYEERLANPHLRGVVPRCLEAIFDFIAEADPESEYRIIVSYLEVDESDHVNDLLESQNRNLSIRQSPHRGIFVQNLTEVYTSSIDDCYHQLALGDHNKAMAVSDLNATNCPSDTIYTIRISQRNLMNGYEVNSQLNLVDLGSRRSKAAHATLGRVVTAIVRKAQMIPYRDSKLTRILQESIGGNSKMTMILHASPHPMSLNDTLSTLRFGTRMKKIRLRLARNVTSSPSSSDQQRSPAQRDRILRRNLLSELSKLGDNDEEEDDDDDEQLRNQLAAMTARCKKQESQLNRAKAALDRMTVRAEKWVVFVQERREAEARFKEEIATVTQERDDLAEELERCQTRLRELENEEDDVDDD